MICITMVPGSFLICIQMYQNPSSCSVVRLSFHVLCSGQNTTSWIWWESERSSWRPVCFKLIVARTTHSPYHVPVPSLVKSWKCANWIFSFTRRNRFMSKCAIRFLVYRLLSNLYLYLSFLPSLHNQSNVLWNGNIGHGTKGRNFLLSSLIWNMMNGWQWDDKGMTNVNIDLSAIARSVVESRG